MALSQPALLDALNASGGIEVIRSAARVVHSEFIEAVAI